MRVRYTRQALAQLAELQAYIEQDRPRAAKKVGDTIRASVSRLADFPELGRQGRVTGSRELVIPRLPVVVAYRVTESHVDILAILHASRRWPSTFDS